MPGFLHAPHREPYGALGRGVLRSVPTVELRVEGLRLRGLGV